jgi:anti-sigma factor RsiW
MNPCDGYVIKTLRYLDNDLKGEELETFRSHLRSCAECRAHVEAEKVLSESLHRARPLYSAPAALRDQVAAIEQSSASPVQHPLHGRAQTLRMRLVGGLRHLSSWRVLAPVTVAILLCLILVPNIVRQVHAASYVESAVAMHQRFLGGNLASELQSDSPEAVTAWFANKVPFTFRLPVAESVPGNNPVYRLTGASLVSYKGNAAALVTYQAPHDKISLLVASTRSALVAGGEEVGFGTLTFHYRTESGFRVITWTNHGLSYALVSSVQGPARASCLICHQNMADHSDFTSGR